MIPVICLVILLSAQTLVAQTVTVRSGEHAGFTRLVLTQPAPDAWDFGRSETGYVLRLRSKIRSFEISTVFDRIGKARLNGLAARPADGLLALDIPCACHAIATPFRPGIIVIDIADGPAPPGSPFEEVLLLPVQGEGWARSSPQIRPPRRPAAIVEPPKRLPFGPRRLLGRPELPPFAQRLIVPDLRATLLNERLSRELSRGIATGAIASAHLPAPAANTRPRQPAAALPSANRPVAGPQLNTRPPGAPPSREPPASGVACVPADQLALATWGDDRPASIQIAEARQAILTEFDRPDAAGLLRLARLYLHFGLGAEASELFVNWPLGTDDVPILQALGALIDGTAPLARFKDMQSCDGPAALWSVLEHDTLPPGIDHAALLRGFSDLPPWLRRELGPRLAQSFISSGDLVTAQNLEQMMTRALPADSPEAAFIGGQIDIARGQSEEAAPRLASVARANSPLAPLASVALLETKLARGEPISQEEITGLEALAKSHRDSAEAPALRRTLARSLIAAGEVERAFESIAVRTPELYPQLWELLAQRGSDADLARQVLAPQPGSLRDLPPKTRKKLADRLITAGFPTKALEMMEVLTGPEADLTRARAHLALRDGRNALRHLAGAAGEGAATVRAEALELLDDLEGAALAWQEAGNEPRAARLQQLRQNWDDLPASAPPDLRALAQSFTQPPSLPPEPLARARAQIAAASGLRHTAVSLIQQPPTP